MMMSIRLAVQRVQSCAELNVNTESSQLLPRAIFALYLGAYLYTAAAIYCHDTLIQVVESNVLDSVGGRI